MLIWRVQISFKKKGSVLVGLESSARFLDAVRKVTNTVSTIADDEIIKCYRKLLRKLETFFKETDLKPLTSIGIIKSILQKDNDLFNAVEVVDHCICTAAFKISVESIVESLVSRYKKHLDSSRQMTEEHSLEEMSIADNGPLLQHADPLLERAVNKYWKRNESNERGEWHFIRRSDDIRSYTGGSSKVIGKMLKEKSKLPFMDDL